MYYIVNQTNHILAADNALLSLLCVENIEELHKSILLNNIKFTFSSDNKLKIENLEEISSYKTTIHTLSSLLGDIKLIEFNNEEDNLADTIDTLSEEEKEEETILTDNNKLFTLESRLISEDLSHNHKIVEEEKEKESLEIKDEPISILDDEPLIFESEETEESAEDDLISLVEDEEESIEVETPKEEIEEIKDEPISILDDEPLIFESEETEETQSKEESAEDDLISLLKDEPLVFESEETEETQSKEDSAEDDLISLLEDEPSKAEEEIDNILTKNTSSDTKPENIDIEQISKKIGISTEDYTEFLNEYAETALTLENDLKSTQESKKSHAVSTLMHLSEVLHITSLKPILENIQNSTDDNQIENIQSLYGVLSVLTNKDMKIQTAESNTSETVEEINIEETIELEDTPIELSVEDKIEVIDNVIEPIEEEVAVNPNSFGTIDLSDVKPIHFDFLLDEAANDLSLPVELIKEFVIDFIDQAHEETEKMLKAYENGDLDTIQKIGHLLKGTSSNLRINPLADTLYKIQFCEESSELEALIRDYWGHFLSFENQIKHIV